MLYALLVSAADSIKSMHLIFPAEMEALYADHLHEMKRHSTWAFVLGFFLPLLYSESMLLSHLYADGHVELPVLVTVRIACTLLLFIVSGVVCINCFGQSMKVNREGVWLLIILALLSTLLFRQSDGEAGGTGLFEGLLVVLAFAYLPLRIPAALLLLLIVSVATGVASATGLNDLKRSEVGVIISLTVSALRTLALLEANQRRSFLEETNQMKLSTEPELDSQSTDKESYRDLSSQVSGSKAEAGLPGQVPEQAPAEQARAKEKRRTAPPPLRITRAGSLNSAKERKAAMNGDGHMSPRRPPRRKSEGNAFSPQRLSIDELKATGTGSGGRIPNATLKTQREAHDPLGSAAAVSLQEPLSPRRAGKHLAFADSEVSSKNLSIVPCTSPMPQLERMGSGPTSLHPPGAAGLGPAAPATMLSNSVKSRSPSMSEFSSRILSGSSVFRDSISQDLNQGSKRSLSRQSWAPLSYSQSSGSLDSTPLPAIAHMACQTDIVWKEGDWHCTRCAKPPSLPGGPPSRSDSRTKTQDKQRSAFKHKHLKAAMEMVGRLQGTWRLVYGPDNVSPWLREFTIYRTDVFAEGMSKKLDFHESVAVSLGGGELILDNEEYLHRHGRTGQHLMFERLDEDMDDYGDDENIFVRQLSQNSVESSQTIGEGELPPYFP